MRDQSSKVVLLRSHVTLQLLKPSFKVRDHGWDVLDLLLHTIYSMLQFLLLLAKRIFQVPIPLHLHKPLDLGLQFGHRLCLNSSICLQLCDPLKQLLLKTRICLKRLDFSSASKLSRQECFSDFNFLAQTTKPVLRNMLCP